MRTNGIFIAVFLAALVAGCAPSKKLTTTEPVPLPPPKPSSPSIPQPIPTPPEAAMHISVAYPTPGQARPNVDSNFIFGTVGNGDASLAINGHAVPVAKNGAFLAFLPMPKNGEYNLTAKHGNDIGSSSFSYGPKEIPKTQTSSIGEDRQKFSPPKFATISKGSDTLQTGNDVAPGATTPDGNREWFFPRGARLSVVEHDGKYYKVQLDKTTSAWVADSNIELTSQDARSNPYSMGEIHSSMLHVDLIFPGNFDPFQIIALGSSLRVRTYVTAHTDQSFTSTSDQLISSAGYDSTSGSTDFIVRMKKPVWGYKAFYMGDGSLRVRIRRPPEIDHNNPLKGIRIMIDPGHPPAGAIGPTGFTEREANLAEAKKVRDMLVSKGATVLMTHTALHGMVSDDNQVEELAARTKLAVQNDVDLMVSIHNNAFPDGTNPFLNFGTSTFYFHSFSAPLAADLDKEIAAVTGIPNLGAMKKSLAVCRPTWMPCALTESLYLMFPDQESA
ncbi:MAG: N-acetylmuramoyl-L-alanine amidase, partial [Candidatus Kapaibacterium sp.]